MNLCELIYINAMYESILFYLNAYDFVNEL
jgi:hypothetical protein